MTRTPPRSAPLTPPPARFSAYWVLLLAGGASVMAFSIAAQVYLSMPGHDHSFPRMFGWQWCSWIYWAALLPAGLALGRRLVAGAGTPARRDAVLFGVAAVGLHVLLGAQLEVWFQPFAPREVMTFRTALSEQWWSLSTDLLAYLTVLLIGGAVAAYNRAGQLQLRESRLEAELARAQLEALRLEVQPHFLFNTLNSIASLIRVNASDRALDMLVGLGDLMRTTLERPTSQLVTLASELDFTKRYIELQQARFADRLEVEYAIADGSDQWAVPSFMLQPLVENAFRHGIGRRSGTGVLQIGSRIEQGRLRVWVVDDGGGLPAGFSLPRDAGTGLGNIWSRLEHLYGGAASLTVRAGDRAGTIVELLLPA